MLKRLRITESLDIDIEEELWCCNRCGYELGPARENYKKFTLVGERDPREIHRPYVPQESSPDGYNTSPDPEWVRILEFYCPHCAAMFEVEYLPPGHPITYDLQLDIDKLKAKYC